MRIVAHRRVAVLHCRVISALTHCHTSLPRSHSLLTVQACLPAALRLLTVHTCVPAALRGLCGVSPNSGRCPNPTLTRTQDVGCCFGQESRKLIADGFPEANVIASDIISDYWCAMRAACSALLCPDASAADIVFTGACIMKDSMPAVGLDRSPLRQAHARAGSCEHRVQEGTWPCAWSSAWPCSHAWL